MTATTVPPSLRHRAEGSKVALLALAAASRGNAPVLTGWSNAVVMIGLGIVASILAFAPIIPAAVGVPAGVTALAAAILLGVLADWADRSAVAVVRWCDLRIAWLGRRSAVQPDEAAAFPFGGHLPLWRPRGQLQRTMWATYALMAGVEGMTLATVALIARQLIPGRDVGAALVITLVGLVVAAGVGTLFSRWAQRRYRRVISLRLQVECAVNGWPR